MQRLAYIPLLIIALISSVVFIVIKVRTPKCAGLNFAVPLSGRVDELLSFVDSTPVRSVSRLWDFGDSSTATEGTTTHRYKRPGKYIVSLTINGTCKDLQQIEIVPKPALQIQLAQIQGPAGDVYAGDRISLTELTPDGTEWEWAFGESGKVDAKTKDVSHIYTTTGYKKISVFVTTPSGKLSGTYTVNIKNRDVGTKAQMLTPKDIAGAMKPTGAAKKKLFETKLTAFLTANDIGARQKLHNEMRELVCSPQIHVLWITPWLKKNKNMTFDDFCVEVMHNKDAYNITEQTVTFDDAKDCVNDVRLKMKAK
ncbi:MAG: domain containing protein [Bacteroidetes bacterium]|nr:domain containing protein [Bacteroidota bacterium]